jgi:hypothetical protein
MAIANYSLSKRKSGSPLQGLGVGPRGEPTEIGSGAAVVNPITGPGLPGPGTTVSFGGNPILMDARVALIFYGSAWNNLALSPNCNDIQNAVSTILKTPYLSVLLDYQCNGGITSTIWDRIVTNPPGNPFDGSDCGGVANDLIDGFYSTLPTYNRPNFYAFFLPPGVSLEQSGASGAHSNDGDTFYSWQLYGTLDYITSTFSHELVEAMTDPDGNGWQVDPRSDSNWNEICDVCNNVTQRVNGVLCAAYYSTSYQGCVVPQPDPPPPPPPTLPNGTYQITCANFRSHNGIEYVGVIGGNFNGKPWTMVTDNAIARVQRGELSFFTEVGNQRATVVIGHSLVASFLTTSADATVENNLDYMARNNTCDIEDVPIFG